MRAMQNRFLVDASEKEPSRTQNNYNVCIQSSCFFVICYFVDSIVLVKRLYYFVKLNNISPLTHLYDVCKAGSTQSSAAYHDKIRPYGRLVLSHPLHLAVLMMDVVLNPNYFKF